MAMILVVEDDDVTRRLLSHTLSRAGYDVVTTQGGAQGLDAMAEEVIDLVICDLQMPDISGIDFLKHVRADSRYDDIPIVMLTASGDDIYRKEAIASGANVFLTKPTRSQDLRQTVARLVGS